MILPLGLYILLVSVVVLSLGHCAAYLVPSNACVDYVQGPSLIMLLIYSRMPFLFFCFSRQAFSVCPGTHSEDRATFRV